MINDDWRDGFSAGIGTSILFFFFVSFILLVTTPIDKTKNEAVKRGYAVWAEDNGPKFRWKDENTNTNSR